MDSQATKFSERVFTILDQDLSGMLNLREFIIGVWNYCTYDVTLVSKVKRLPGCEAAVWLIVFAESVVLMYHIISIFSMGSTRRPADNTQRICALLPSYLL